MGLRKQRESQIKNPYTKGERTDYYGYEDDADHDYYGKEVHNAGGPQTSIDKALGLT